MSLWPGLRPWRSCHSCALRHALFVVQSELRVRFGLRFGLLRIPLDAVSGMLRHAVIAVQSELRVCLGFRFGLLRIPLDAVSGILRHAVIVVQSEPRVRLGLQCSLLRIPLNAVSGMLRHAVIVLQSEPRVRLGLRCSLLRIPPDAVSGILFAIDRTDMRWVSIEIGSADSKLFLVRIDPFPQLPTRSQSLCPCLALYADDIGRSPVTVAAAKASTM